MSNTLTFFGEVINGGGARTGRSGKIITFTAEKFVKMIKPAGRGRPVQPQSLVASWRASTARTIEEITKNDLVKDLQPGWFLILAVPHDQKLGNGFKFKPNETLSRFSINIYDAGKDLGGLDFFDLKVGPINQVIHKDRMISGVMHRLSESSIDEIPCNIGKVSVR